MSTRETRIKKEPRHKSKYTEKYETKPKKETKTAKVQILERTKFESESQMPGPRTGMPQLPKKRQFSKACRFEK